MPGPIHRFGPFRFDSGERLLYRDGELVPLMPKMAGLLAALLERRGQVVRKVELLREVPPDAHGEKAAARASAALVRGAAPKK